jgi:hypothetical protein
MISPPALEPFHGKIPPSLGMDGRRVRVDNRIRKPAIPLLPITPSRE